MTYIAHIETESGEFFQKHCGSVVDAAVTLADWPWIHDADGNRIKFISRQIRNSQNEFVSEVGVYEED